MSATFRADGKNNECYITMMGGVTQHHVEIEWEWEEKETLSCSAFLGQAWESILQEQEIKNQMLDNIFILCCLMATKLRRIYNYNPACGIWKRILGVRSKHFQKNSSTSSTININLNAQKRIVLRTVHVNCFFSRLVGLRSHQ